MINVWTNLEQLSRYKLGGVMIAWNSRNSTNSIIVSLPIEHLVTTHEWDGEGIEFNFRKV